MVNCTPGFTHCLAELWWCQRYAADALDTCLDNSPSRLRFLRLRLRLLCQLYYLEMRAYHIPLQQMTTCYTQQAADEPRSALKASATGENDE